MNTDLIRDPRKWAESIGYFRFSRSDHARLRLLLSEALEGGMGEDATSDERRADRRILRKLRAAERKTKR